MMTVDDTKWLIACILALLAGSVVLAPPPSAAGALPIAAESVSPTITPIILTDSWPIKRVIGDRSGALVFAGGNVRGGADGLVYIAPDKFKKPVAIGDPVPGKNGMYFVTVGVMEFIPYGTTGDFSFNSHGDLAFTADVVSCGSASQVAQCAASSQQRQGLFLFSETNRTTIALQGDPAPGSAGGTFLAFFRIWINSSGTVLFHAELDQSTGFADGLFTFSQNRLEKVAISGEATPLGTIYLGTPLSISDEDVVTFTCSFSGAGYALVRYAAGVLTRLAGGGDPAPSGGQLGSFSEGAINHRGDVVFHSRYAADGVYLLDSEGSVSKIIGDGESTPIGGYFALTGYSSIDKYRLVYPQMNDSADVLFSSPINSGPSTAGLFLAARGTVEKVVARGDPLPGGSPLSTYPFMFDLNDLGMSAFSVSLYPQQSTGVFAYSKGNTFGVFLTGDSAPQTDGSFQELKEFFLTDSGDVIFHSTVCCGKVKEGIFQAGFPRANIPNGSFESLGDKGLPAGWQVTWTNSGSGDVRQNNCGACALDGSSVLRLHVGAEGGAVFVVSDPISINPSSAYMISGHMRYKLQSAADAAFFTMIQSDSAGNTVDLNEVEGSRVDNSGVWVPKGMLMRTKPTAVSMRIRIGLASATETSLDVDTMH